MTKTILAVLTASLMLSGSIFAKGAATNYPPDRDPYGYYSQYDHEGFYDREGHYVRFRDQRAHDTDYSPTNAAPPPPAQIYTQGNYEEQCRKGNTVAGTLFGALAGGLIGGAASSGRHHGADGGAVVGGAILGGLLGNAISRDMPCEDHPYAMRVYADGLNGDVGHRYEWRNSSDRGDFVVVREYDRRGNVCRDFRETTYIGGRTITREGVACRMSDGYWHFD